MKRILLTGVTGLLGSHVLSLLQAAGYEVAVTVRPGSAGHLAHDLLAIPLDLGRDDGWEKLPSSIDAVIHCAARIPDTFQDLSQAEALWQVNGLGTLRLLQWAKTQGVRRFVYGSSHAVYARPLPFPVPETHATYPAGHAIHYALSKLAGELFVSSQNGPDFQVCSLRFPTLFGPRMRQGGVLSHFISLAKKGDPIHITVPAESLFDFLYVRDAAQAVLAAVTAVLNHPVYNVGAGRGMTLPVLAQAVWATFAPPSVPQITVSGSGAPVHSVLDISRARKDLNYQPNYTLPAALTEMKNGAA